MKYNYVHRHLSQAFYELGLHIGKHPKWYIAIPVMVTLVLITGFARAVMETEAEYLFTPIDGRSNDERAAIEKLFPRNKSQPLDFSRLTVLPPFGSLIALAKDGGDILRESILDELALVDSIVHDVNVTWGNRTYGYEDICLREYDGECFRNEGLDARGKIKHMKKGRFKIRYPVEVDRVSYSVKLYGFNYGGVVSDEDGYVQEVKAFRLFYVLEEFVEKQLTERWMQAFTDRVSTMDFDTIDVYRFSRKALNEETNMITYKCFPLLVLAVVTMIIYGALTCMSTDWVHSEPWAGVAGCISSLLGMAAGFGSLLLFGAEYVDINIAIVFLMLGIGMDDSFVILAAWKNSDPKSDVRKRIGEAFRESATSITITSLTNVMASCTGLLTSYRTIRVYSLYAAMSVFFVYIAQITFFGGCLVLSGYREVNNYHSLLICYPIKRKPSRGFFRKLFIEGCAPIKYINVNNNAGETAFTSRFYGALGSVLSNVYAKIAVILTFLCYFGMATYCLRYLVIAFDYTEAFSSDSFAKPFVDLQYRYFTKYPFRVQVVINTTLDYSDQSVRHDVERTLHTLETAPNMAGPSFTESWLREYLEFINDRRVSWFSLSNYNMSRPEDFVEGLRDIFLNIKGAERFKNDILFSEDGTKIIASRFILQSENLTDTVIERKFINSMWNLADSSEYPIYIHNFYFFLYDLSSSVEKTTIQCLVTSSILVTIVFLLFFPNITCALCVASTIIFIEVELIGFMSLWGVQLNLISMICLVLSVGLCVDYAAHISCSYMSNKEVNPNAKMRRALLNVGYPITQGCTSSIIGVVVLSCAQVESVVIFFKIVTLLMLSSLFHGLFLIPVLLCLWDELYQRLDKPCNVVVSSEASESCLKSASGKECEKMAATKSMSENKVMV